MQCSACHTHIDDSKAKFCSECGQPVPQSRICPGCGSALKPAAKFCSECGTATGQGDAASSSMASGLLGYCAGSGGAITASTPHFKCLDCDKLYLESQRFEDKPVCRSCAYASGMAQAVEQQRADQARLEAEHKVQEEAERRRLVRSIIGLLRHQLIERKARKERELWHRKLRKLGMTDADWVDIPAGSFMMGSPESEEGRFGDERCHHVSVAAFKMLKSPVTFAMYDAFCEATGREKADNRGWGRCNRPVILVSYWDAVDYCVWLSKMSGWQVRLPTEAEWEYACRAGTSTPFWTGDTISTDQANYNGNYTCGNGGKGVWREKTMPVDIFPPNPWGLHDMHGNVLEWCASEYDGDYSSMEQRDASADRSNDSGRVLRGGSWFDHPRDLRSANRHMFEPDYIEDFIGFRLVREI